ncbi:hypothetical protein FRC96_06135 [Lujinxingia vulgaris]|uniref:Right handed beta helix domain-containing protein n=1 Tax=Lujinxingia vulgaris TaxID=2600176 RepID=A0A5C6XEL6_9DELT|nr:hypothetical protein [Lujinxingia vulgaris]TXD39847.1 hypothetical protein FRC96_06135 [Lujinxingia vulgaris]
MGAASTLHALNCLDVLGKITNLYVENVVFEGCESRIQGSDEEAHRGITLRRSMLLDAHLGEPVDEAEDWRATHENRISAVYISNVDGIFIDECYADTNGWQPGYDPEAGPGPQPPSKYSHNFYLQGDNSNVVLRGSISSRGASFGAQVRSGGIVQDNVFIANNAAYFTGTGTPSLVERNVVTIAGNKVAFDIGARGWGLDTKSVSGSVLRDNVVIHSVDPLDSATEDFASGAISNTTGVTAESNVVWNWGSSENSPASLPDGVQGDAISLLNYIAPTPIGDTDLDAFDRHLRQRDRDNWPAYLSAQAIIEHFSVLRQPQ